MVAEAIEPVFFETITPSTSGIEVRYTPEQEIDGKKIKRKYEVRVGALRPVEEGGYPTDWREVPSVTTVLDVLDTPLHWWGMERGIEGTLELHRLGELRATMWPDFNGGKQVLLTKQDVVAGVGEVVALLTEHKLTVNHVRDKASDRGTAVHDAFELWAREGHMPDPEMFPDEQRGYVAGLVLFLKDIAIGGAEPLAAEVMVGSIEHGFAGRYDVRFRTYKPCQVVYHRTPVRGAKYATLDPGTFLGDLKTSKGVYLKHSKQLEGYEIASVECGYEPTDARGIIHVTADGNYEFVRSQGVAHDFLTTLAEWKSQQDMKARRAK